MSDYEDHIDKLGKENRELRKLESQVSDSKHQYTFAVMGTLIENLEECIGKLIVQNDKNVYFDKDLGETITSTIKELVVGFSKIKAPTVTVNPNISVDFKPVSDEISKQNKTIIALLEKIGNGGNSDEVAKSLSVIIAKQNSFLDKTFEQINYTEKLTELIKVIKDSKPLVEKLKVIRDRAGITEVIPVYKK